MPAPAPKPGPASGASTSTVAAAVAIPIVVVALGAGLFFYRRYQLRAAAGNAAPKPIKFDIDDGYGQVPQPAAANNKVRVDRL